MYYSNLVGSDFQQQPGSASMSGSVMRNTGSQMHPRQKTGELHTKVAKQLLASPVGQGELFRTGVLDLDGLKDGPWEFT